MKFGIIHNEFSTMHILNLLVDYANLEIQSAGKFDSVNMYFAFYVLLKQLLNVRYLTEKSSLLYGKPCV